MKEPPSLRPTFVLVALLAAGCVPDVGATDGPPVRRLPGEFEPIDELLVTWDDGDDLEPMFAQMVAEASWSSRVVVVLDRAGIADEVYEAVVESGGDTDQVALYHSDRDSLWLRDYGPLVVQEGPSRMVYDFRYFGAQVDDTLTKKIARRRWSRGSTELDVRLEGGNLLSNGDGICLTSEIVLTDNPGHSEAAIRRLLASELGCRELLILPKLEGEGTGHVDMYLTVIDAKRVLVGRYNRGVDRENARRLDRAATMLAAAGFQVTRLPMPDHSDGVFRTYANAVLVNDLVMVPVYDSDVSVEKAALDVFEKALPDRRVIAVESSNLIELAGAIHCVTMTVAR